MLRIFLQELQLVDKGPSQYIYRRWKQISSGNVEEEVLKSIWIKILPILVQDMLLVSNDNLDGLVLVADSS